MNNRILKDIIKMKTGCEVVDSSGSGWQRVAGFCEYDNESLGTIYADSFV
jgi:hypothetical protein